MQQCKHQHAAATTACHDNSTDDNDTDDNDMDDNNNVNGYNIKMTMTIAMITKGMTVTMATATTTYTDNEIYSKE